MQTEQLERSASLEGQKAILTFVRTMLGGLQGREDPENPLPSGPWDPVIRTALERLDILGLQRESLRGALANLLAQTPEIHDVIGGRRVFGSHAALNPQPLPPRFAFLLEAAQVVIDRAELLQEIADAVRESERQDPAASRYVTRFVDDVCGNGFRLKFPRPGPRPWWFADALSGTDLVVLAAHFGAAAKTAFDPALGESFEAAGAQLAEAGLSRM